jgi:SAM-dependent methyltransferase
MSSGNFDLYSAYYDLLYKDKPYAEEADFITTLLGEYGGEGRRLLELGCGTGIHATHFAEQGFAVHGIDQSAEMLRLAEMRRASQPDAVAGRLSFSQGDLRSFSAGGQYDQVISLFDVFSYIPDNAAFAETLGRVKVALKSGGLLVFDCWYGPAVYTQRPQVRVRRLSSDKAEIVRIAEPVFHHRRNVIDVNYDIYARNLVSGEISNFKELHPMRCYFDAELDALMAEAGFSRRFAMEWFTRHEPSTSSWSVLFGYRLEQREADTSPT